MDTVLVEAVTALAAQWRLTLGKPCATDIGGSWVAPASGVDGRDLVLKVAHAHEEARDEAVGLRLWAGRGAVQVHDEHTDGDVVALLLEHVRPGTALRDLREEVDQDVVLADLLQRLWIAAPSGHQLRALRQMCEQWAREHVDDPRPLDPGLVRAGFALWLELPTTADRETVLVTDLHAGNVLAATREPWLMIDPKPYVGDPAYDPLQHLLNCPGRLHTEPRALVDRMAGLCGVQAERLRLWLFARCVVESAWRSQLALVAAELAP